MAKEQKQGFGITSQAGRLLKLTGMTTSIASKVAGHQVKKIFQSEESQARDREKLMRDVGRQVAETLGEMKGAVMKVGQIASQMQDLLPPEIADALTVLQKASAPMPYSIIRRQIKNDLGDFPENLFAQFDEKPFAAASIGQVHKALTHDGQEVVVKVQYPAVKSSIDSDLRQLRRIFKLGALFKINEETLDAVFDEIRTQLQEELDYQKEAENLETFRQFHADTPWIHIPEVLPALSSEHVLTLEYLPGDDLDLIEHSSRYSDELRNLLGTRLFDALSEQIFKLQQVHCDPHPGNFAFRDDGSIIFYDFGAIKRIPEQDIFQITRLMRAAIANEAHRMDDILLDLGVRKSHGPVIAPDFYQEWINLLVPPLYSGEAFDYRTSKLHLKVAQKARTTPWRYLESFQPSARTLLVDRVIGGHYWTMKRLGVNQSFRESVNIALGITDQG